MPSTPLPQTNGAFVHFERMVDRARGSLLRQDAELVTSGHPSGLQTKPYLQAPCPAPQETEQVVRDLRLAGMDVLHLIPASLTLMVPGLEQALASLHRAMTTQTLDEAARMLETGPDNI